MFNQLRMRMMFSIIVAVSGAVSFSCGLSRAGSTAAHVTSARVQSIQAAQAELQKEQAADWHAVIAADKAEIVSLNAATTAAMKAGNADAVVAAQGLLKTVKIRLAAEKILTAFPPYFQAAANIAGLSDPALNIEVARNKAVASAVAQVKQSQAVFREAVVAADQNAIAQWKRQISADMKAGKPQAVVADMSSMKQLQQQLQDSMAAPSVLPAPGMGDPNQPAFGPQEILPHPGILNPTVPAYRPSGFFPGVGQPGPAGGQSQVASIGGAISSDLWPKLITEALKPVAAYSVPSLVAELARYRTDPRRIIGKRVVAFLKRDSTGQLIIGGAVNDAPRLSRQQRLQELGIRNQIIGYFRRIRKNARQNRKNQYNNELNELKIEDPTATEWQVPQSMIFQWKSECSKVTSAAYSAQRKDLRLVALAFLVPPDRAEIVAPAGAQAPTSGAVYGVVVGLVSKTVSRQTPSIYYSGGYPYLSVPPEQIPPCTVYTVKILYCARAPQYLRAKRVVVPGPIKGYVFLMKSGTRMEAATYTTGNFYYHLKWNGINLTVAKDLVVKIRTVR